MIIGYARVSTEQQSLNRQIDRLQEAHCERIFSDKVSGTKKDRPEFTMMMNTIREGDIIIVCELSRLVEKMGNYDVEQMLFGREYHQKYIDSTTVTHKKSGLP